MRELKALEILEKAKGMFLYKGLNDMVTKTEKAISELEALQAPKTCESCSHRLDPNRQFQSFSCALLKRHVRNDFYCADYEPKDNA